MDTQASTHGIRLSFVPTLLSLVHIHSFYLCTQKQTIIALLYVEIQIQLCDIVVFTTLLL